MADFHFLRPLWLLLLLVALVLPLVFKRVRQSDSGWSRVIPPQLLRPLISQSGAAGGQTLARIAGRCRPRGACRCPRRPVVAQGAHATATTE